MAKFIEITLNQEQDNLAYINVEHIVSVTTKFHKGVHYTATDERIEPYTTTIVATSFPGSKELQTFETRTTYEEVKNLIDA